MSKTSTATTSWFRVRSSLPTEPAVLGMTIELEIDVHSLLGKLVWFWAWVDQHVAIGDDDVDVRAGITPRIMDHLVGCDGFANAYINAGWARIDDGELVLINIGKHVGSTAKQRAEDSHRKYVKRTKEALKEDTHGTTSGQVSDTSRTSRGQKSVKYGTKRRGEEIRGSGGDCKGGDKRKSKASIGDDTSDSPPPQIEKGSGAEAEPGDTVSELETFLSKTAKLTKAQVGKVVKTEGVTLAGVRRKWSELEERAKTGEIKRKPPVLMRAIEAGECGRIDRPGTPQEWYQAIKDGDVTCTGDIQWNPALVAHSSNGLYCKPTPTTPGKDLTPDMLVITDRQLKDCDYE